ncbi:hypothetical protein PSV09DRAFT_2261149 [Bipolaris maydis]|uniref:uncharacterized protein n=1 Tax=Cochliobolus heterostrophus TaxID=5016 RepID=UPI0024D816D0|nr:hypothetical protein J3E73DRAFT_259726 [Bipolaris maydis]KAJ5058540.1 hypothetical protein J3E74DRAFT_292573 [Bipolaris maydis]KAJ6206570.1 hypothetical protein PSV09DRAFT_2261149 [Bipolaris maydis]KAJ6269270.1 hypothetical protein PSV08DRAFT_249372 [Bipolaris maydis]KAJ6280083.1 hypothetical protein J3E71DRAFT_242736 [Bipolaris maydis]
MPLVLAGVIVICQSDGAAGQRASSSVVYSTAVAAARCLLTGPMRTIMSVVVVVVTMMMMTMQAALPMLPSTLAASVAGMGSPSWAGCNGSATVAVQTCTCMQIRRCWTQLALPARLSAGSGSVGAGGGGGHGPPWLPTTGSRGLQAGVIGSGAAGGAVEGGCRCTWRMGQPWAASLSTPLHGGA